jgi:opine dehydrogenase
MTIKTIAIMGAGHGGLAAAADLGARGYRVHLHARRDETLAPIREAGGVTAQGVQDGLFPVALLTTDVAEAVDGADLVMLVVPSVAHRHYARALAPLMRPDLPVFVNPGHTGGGLHFTAGLREAGYADDLRCCESVTLTYICRKTGPAAVDIFSYVKKLKFAAFPGRHAEELFALLKPVYPEIELRSSVLETGLTNINAVFHPPGMILNAGWIQATGGDFLFYREGITPAVGRATEAVDEERMAVARALGVPTASFLDNFLQAGLTTAEAAASGDISRTCIESEPNKSIKSPPSLDHRYVHEDVGYGLVPFAAFGDLAGVETPTMDALVSLASTMMGIDYATDGLTLARMGLAGLSPADLDRFVQEGK